MKINEVLIRPVLTEKATSLAAHKVYAFEVNRKANKTVIAEAIKKIFSVKIDKVRLITRPGKVHRSGRKMTAKKTSPRKIAYVTVSEGKIDLFPQA